MGSGELIFYFTLVVGRAFAFPSKLFFISTHEVLPFYLSNALPHSTVAVWG